MPFTSKITDMIVKKTTTKKPLSLMLYSRVKLKSSPYQQLTISTSSFHSGC
jgi:hypothetical protein